MTAPTKTPQGAVRIISGPVYELTILNPFEQAETESQDRIASLRVYHAAHAGADFSLLEEHALPYACPGEQPFFVLELNVTSPGVFRLSFLNGQETPEEGPVSNAVPYVYGETRLLWQQLYSNRCLAVTPTTVLRELLNASREVERYTDRFFHPKWIEMRVNGSGAYLLTLRQPIISIASLHIRGDGSTNARSIDAGFGLISPAFYVVANRHIRFRKAYDPANSTRPDGFLDAPGDGSGGMLDPDDREAPAVMFRVDNKTVLGRPNNRYRVFSGTRDDLYRLSQVGFVRGNQNILLRGFFGYTEEDVSTPAQIHRVAELLATRNGVLRWGEEEDADRERMKHKTIMVKTDAHLWMGEAKDRLAGSITGDPEIDRILVHYRRPAEIGVV